MLVSLWGFKMKRNVRDCKLQSVFYYLIVMNAAFHITIYYKRGAK